MALGGWPRARRGAGGGLWLWLAAGAGLGAAGRGAGAAGIGAGAGAGPYAPAALLWGRAPGTGGGTFSQLGVGAGGGAWAAPVAVVAAGGEPEGPPGADFLATGDFDLDGLLDVVEAATGGGRPGAVHLSNGDGTFRFGAALDLEGCDVRSLVAADVNRDHLPDILVACYGSPDLLFLAVGEGAFDPARELPGTPNGLTTSLTTGDFDGDGNTDIVAGSAESDFDTIFLSPGSAGNFTTGEHVAPESAGWTTSAVVAADLDGDGVLDLLCVNADGASHVMRGLANGTFSTPSGLAGGAFFTSAAVADFDGDGAPDIALGAPGRPNVVLLGAEGGAFRAGVPVEGAEEGDDTRALAAADIDGDGIADLVAANGHGADKIYIAWGLGKLGFHEPQFPGGRGGAGSEGKISAAVMAFGGSETRGGPLEWHGTWMQPGLLLEGVWLNAKMDRMGAELERAQSRLAVQEARGVGEATFCEGLRGEIRRTQARSTRALVAASVALAPLLALAVAFGLRALPGASGAPGHQAAARGPAAGGGSVLDGLLAPLVPTSSAEI